MAILVLAALTTLFIARGFGQSRGPNTTDFHTFYWAAEAMVQGRDLYTSGQGAYIYPPLLAWLFTPLTHLPLATALRAWIVVSLAITGVSLFVLSRDVAKRMGMRPEGLLIAWVSMLSLAANFEQIGCEFEQGQCDTIVLLGFSLGLALLDKRPWLAGVALGLAFNIKYQSLFVLPYLLLRRRWAAASSMVLSGLAFLFLPALTQGPGENLRSISVAFAGMLNKVGLGPGLDATKAANLYPTEYGRSLSVTSAVARMVDGAHHPLLLDGVVGAIGLVLLALGWYLFRRRSTPLLAGRSAATDSQPPMPGVVAIEWAGIVAVTLAFSPHTTARHTFMVLPIHVVALTILLRPRPGVSPWPLIVGTIAYTAGIMLPPGGVWAAEALRAWRCVGGTVWCMLLMYFTLVWTGLRYVRSASTTDSAALP